MKALGLRHEEDVVMLLFFCHLLVNKSDDDVRFNQLEDLFADKDDFGRAKAHLRRGDHTLMCEHLIEHLCVDGIVDNTRFRLTDQARRDLLDEFNLGGAEEKLANVMPPERLTPREFFYSDAVARQVDELAALLDVAQYWKIRQRMQERGFRQGFTCLFHGGPGTGKTETVYQLARRTGRKHKEDI